jgi:hypothetical protein
MSNKTKSTTGAFGSKKTNRSKSVAQLSKLIQALFQQMSKQQNDINDYYGTLCQMTEACEKGSNNVPEWIVKKARLLIDSNKPLQEKDAVEV